MTTDLSAWPVVLVRPPERPLSDAEFAAYLDWTEKHVTCRGELYAMVLDNRRTPAITANQRRMISEQMNKLKTYTQRYCAGSAMVFESTVIRGIMTAILWMARPDYPTKVFADVDEALDWCKTQVTARRGLLGTGT